MQKFIVAIIAAALVIFFVLTAIRAWRSRSAKQEASFSQPPMALTSAGRELTTVQAAYVATTYAVNHLERVSAYGLGIRGSAQAIVFEGGVQLIRKGERPLAIDKIAITGISTNQVAIDRVTESKGLIAIDWQQDGLQFSTHLRVVDTDERARFIAALETISNRKAN